VKHLLLLVIIAFSPAFVFAQFGTVTGKVLNTKNEPLQGVSVKVAGQTRGISTDLEGRFTLKLAAGTKYELEFTAVNYQAKPVTEVEVIENKVTELNVILESKAGNLNNVIVSTKSNAKRETVNSIIQFQKNTSVVASVISAESIKRSPDRNTGDVLKRVAGLSVQDGKYIIVRGLADRYNQAMLNGIQLSSTEPDRKSFSFDIIPASMVDNIIVNKAFIPELPGEWAGGLVQVNTKEIPSVNFFNIQVGTGFNSQTIGQTFYTYKGGSTDWLGFDDGARDLPSALPTKFQFGSKTNAEKVGLGKTIANDWSYQEASAPINTSLQLSGGFNTKILGKEVGAMVAISYNKSMRRNVFQNNIWTLNRGSLQADPNFIYDNSRYNEDVLAGVLANVTIKLNNANKISFKNILNVNSSKFLTLRTGKDYEFNSLGENIRARELGFRTNTFLTSQVNVENAIAINNFKTKLNWYGSFTILDQYVPQQRRVQYNQDPIAGAPWQLLIGPTLSQKTGSIFYSNLSDYIYNAGVDMTTPFNLFGNKQTVKVGYLFQVKDRLYSARPFSITLPSDNPALRLLPEEQVFNVNNFSDGTVNNKFFVDEYTENRFRYVANSILNAGYIQFDNQFTDKLRAVWGVRFENFDQVVGSMRKSDPRHVYTEVLDFLPAINLTYKLNSKTNIRLSASQTVVRPEFRELTDLAFYDFELGATVVGKKSLERTKITNLDLRYELYQRPGELFSVGFFYKTFDKPIEQIFNGGAGSASTFNYSNLEKATSFGVELEFRKKLDFVTALRNFTFQTNLSYIYNKVSDPAVAIERPMQGQSPYLINAGLQYDLEKAGFSSTLLFNMIGRRILYVGSDVYPEIWEAPRPLFDLQIAKKILKDKAEIKLNISDLLNQQANFYHDLDNSGKYEGADALAIRRVYGTTFSVSFAYNIK
jgi:outer membrane receptor protein involved in Fe transport